MSYADKLFIRTWTSSSLISVLVHMVRGKERQGGTWGSKCKRVREDVREAQKAALQLSLQLQLIKDYLCLGNHVFYQRYQVQERGSPLIHLSRTIIDCPRCTRSGLLLAVSKRLNQAGDTMRSVATAAIICHRDGRADSIQLLPRTRVAAPEWLRSWVASQLSSEKSVRSIHGL